jgi:hypothetical protein
MHMRGKQAGKPVPQPGYIPIFPNNKHGHAFSYANSFDCSSLSPMQLGPVGGAHNLENMYQFSKIFEDELSDTVCTCGNVELGTHYMPGPAFFAARHKAYKDVVPHRHKRRGGKPAYSWYTDAEDGTTHCCTYIQSRWFYCTLYVELASKTPAFQKLKAMYDDGVTKLEIFGYDAFTPDDLSEETLYKHYCDGRRPFGHEMVLLCMLLNTSPWIRNKEEARNKRIKR